MKYLKDYKIVLTIWIALGIACTGYFKINPDIPWKQFYHTLHPDGEPRLASARDRDNPDYTKYETSLVITLVGIVLIGGLGFLHQKRNED